MAEGDPAITALIEAARAEFAVGLASKAASIEALADADAWEEAQRAAHKLRGSAGIYGFEAVGALAGALEEAMRDIGGSGDAAARATVRDKLAALRDEVARSTGRAP